MPETDGVVWLTGDSDLMPAAVSDLVGRVPGVVRAQQSAVVVGHLQG